MPEKQALVGIITLLALSALVIHLSKCNGEPRLVYLLDQVTLLVSMPYLFLSDSWVIHTNKLVRLRKSDFL